MTQHADNLDRTAGRLRDFLPGLFERSPALRPLWPRCDVVLHGSTTLGIDDAFSDYDVWVFAPAEDVAHAEAVAGTRFFAFTLDGKNSHCNLEDVEDARRWLSGCDLERIAELRHCRVLFDPLGVAGTLADAAKRPMRAEVRRAWFFHHYVEMRGWHRNCDNPIERGDELAVLQALVPTLDHALRAAIVLDGEPYPYVKWLGRAAGGTPTGRRVLPLVQRCLDLLADGALRQAGPEALHPLSRTLREIRQILVTQAKAGGIDEPWLDRWWEHIGPARAAPRSLAW